MKRFALFLLALMLLCTSSFASEALDKEGLNMENNSRVFYEIFVGSFSDSDGDGIGDLRGIINRMDYLNDGDPASGQSLGIEGIWLTPIFASPTYHKYDATDYYKIDATFGTLEDLKELIDICHQRDVKLIIDLPLNHTGTDHRWFRNFFNAHLMHNPNNDYYDFYTWLEPDAVIPAGRHFTKMRNNLGLYESNFSDSMPELNFDNEKVRRAVVDVAAYWLDLGVDGFRFDAAKYIYFGEHDKNTEFWTWYMDELKKINPYVYTVGEVWDGDGITSRYLKAFNCFHFSTAMAEGIISKTAAQGDVNKFVLTVQKYQDAIHAENPEAMDIMFLANHDTDRAAGFLSMSNGRAQVAANLYLLSPGSPFMYYGEEIGLRGSRGGENTDANRRLAMVWGDGDTVKDPVGSTYTKQTPYSVKDLEGMGSTILQHYRKVIALRKANPEIARGTYTALSFPDTKAGGFLCAWNGATVGVFHNTTEKTQTLDLSLIPDVSFTWLSFVGTGATLEGTLLTLEGQTSAVLR